MKTDPMSEINLIACFTVEIRLCRILVIASQQVNGCVHIYSLGDEIFNDIPETDPDIREKQVSPAVSVYVFYVDPRCNPVHGDCLVGLGREGTVRLLLIQKDENYYFPFQEFTRAFCKCQYHSLKGEPEIRLWLMV